MSAITAYLADLRANLATGDAREHAYRPALRDLLQALRPGVVAVNDPRQTEAGAVDFIIKDHENPIAWLEAKDLGADLGKVAKTPQLARYLGAYPNLILTDYLTFKWYLGGKLRQEEKLGVLDGGKIVTRVADQQKVEKLLTDFLAQEVYRTGKPEDLAKRMAFLARMAEAAIVGALKQEGQKGQLHSQMAAFKETLLPDLDEEKFADMYAQTIAYGLFAAKCNHPLGDDFNRWSAGQYLPPTNPFLRRLFYELTGPDLDEAVVWVVDELVSLLKLADMGEILATFAKHRQGREDPVVHFYETFLKEYNPKERKIRGVYYTPEPVVSYIVRSVDHLLKTEFDRPLGLADPEVFILDPACGTGTFLYFVIEHIHGTIVEKQGAGAWPGYVREHLLKRVFGFELLMAPYTIAHLKLGMLLKEQGYDFPDDQRLGIYLTNTLEEAKRRSQTLVDRYITEESDAASEVKRDTPVMVVLGNPPYAATSANASVREERDVLGRVRKLSTWIGRLLEDYRQVDGKPLGERNPKLLQDDYVKFIRYGEERVSATGYGILAYITNNSYVSGLVHRGMRAHLLRTFDRAFILNLHGNSLIRETTPDGRSDENVFDIRPGTAISIYSAKRVRRGNRPDVRRCDVMGNRSSKYDILSRTDISTTDWRVVHPESPNYYVDEADASLRTEYEQMYGTNSLFGKASGGIKTHRDQFTVAFESAEMAARIRRLCDKNVSDEQMMAEFTLRNTGTWSLRETRSEAQEGILKEQIVPIQYRPLDIRFICYSDLLADRPRREIMKHLLEPNVALLTVRGIRNPPHAHFWVTKMLVSKESLASEESAYVSPLYLYPEKDSLEAGTPRRPNLNTGFTSDLASRLGLAFVEDGQGDLASTFGPEDVFHYIYAILHSPTYRTRYAEFLKIDFPRIPLTSDLGLFRDLCRLGADLVALHLLKSPLLANSPAKYDQLGDDVVETLRYDEANQRVHINKQQYFSGIDQLLYEFQVGGYQVMNKWLKDRKGRKLSHEDISHYINVAAALSETMRIMNEIDEAIPGWPLS